MADMRLAVGRWRSVIERKRFCALPQFHHLVKHFVFPPERQNFLLASREIHVCGNLLIHAVPPLFPKERTGRPAAALPKRKNFPHNGTKFDRGTTQIDAIASTHCCNGAAPSFPDPSGLRKAAQQVIPFCHDPPVSTLPALFGASCRRVLPHRV